MIPATEFREFIAFAADPDARDWGPREIWTIEEFFDVQH